MAIGLGQKRNRVPAMPDCAVDFGAARYSGRLANHGKDKPRKGSCELPVRGSGCRHAQWTRRVGNGSVPAKRQHAAYFDAGGYLEQWANGGDELANLEFASLGVAQALRTRLTGRNWRSRNPANPLAALAPAWHLP